MAYQKLYRSRKERMLGGVWGGIGQYFNIDPTLFRLIAAILCLVMGGVFAFLVYFILWILIPLEPIKPFTRTRIIDV